MRDKQQKTEQKFPPRGAYTPQQGNMVNERNSTLESDAFYEEKHHSREREMRNARAEGLQFS